MRRLAPALLWALSFGAAVVLAAWPADPAEPPRLASEAVAAIARQWLHTQLAPEVDRAAVELVAAPRELVLPASDATTAASLQAGSLAGGPVTVLVEAISQDRLGVRTTRSTTVTFRINAHYDIVVAGRDLMRRTVLTTADVRLERRAHERVPAGAVRDAREVIGKEVTRPLAAGEVVTGPGLVVPRAVRRGAVVTLLLEGRGFRISARGVASEDGAVGDTIRVVNQSSHREMAGRAEDDRTVRVAF